MKHYGLDQLRLNLVIDYLIFRKQTAKLAPYVVAGVILASRDIPQISILEPLLLNIFINDVFLFIEKSDIYNFAGDNTLLFGGDNIPVIKGSRA